MTPQDALTFAGRHHRAVLATRRPSDGAPQLSPVTVAPADEGHLLVSTRRTAVKYRNLQANPRAWLCLMTDAFFGEWLQVEGPVDFLELPEAMDALIGYYRAVSGEHPDWDDYRAAMERDQRVLLRITPERVGPTVQG